MKKQQINLLITAGVFLFLIPNIIYIIRFWSLNISNKTEHWGQYGDFIGGILNPIVSIISVGVLIYLTVTINNNEAKREKEIRDLEMHQLENDKKIETQKIIDLQIFEDRRLADQISIQKSITISKMRYDQIKEISRILNIFEKSEYKGNLVDVVNNMVSVKSQLINFKFNNRYIFHPIFNIGSAFENKHYNPLNQAMNDLINFIKSQPGVIKKEVEIDFKALGLEFSKQKMGFISGLSLFVINDLNQ